ncbi:MAG TPA: tetratricopeptide repeat protein [Silvibacterium sp.]|nr:tetratricopeptide repeat protein [Silvibacterium sp.]
MAVFEMRSQLTPEERLYKRKLIMGDVAAILTLFAITVALAVMTYFLFNSFSRRRQALARTWLEEGEKAMATGRPEEAVDFFRSALEYGPAQRDAEIKLAMALAAAGRRAEAVSYFNALLESEPGNGQINLQLARIAVEEHHESRAIQDYQRALDGTWEGDGYDRRRAVRLELARYLIGIRDFARARTQLLIASGNAPDEPNVKLEIAGLMEQAQDPSDALDIYRTLAEQKPSRIEALEGAARVSLAMGRFKQARGYLEEVVRHPNFPSQPESARSTYQEMLSEADQLLNLYPAADLRVDERATRILHAATVAQARLAACSADAPQNPSLADLSSKWKQVPAKLKPTDLAREPQLEQSMMTLVYRTEEETEQLCGPPTGEDLLYLKIAQSPLAAGQQ